jgi:hypothetical protein
MTGPLACRNSIPRKPEQRFATVITNLEHAALPNAAGCWDTSKIPDGLHRVKVRTRDRGGNWTDASAEVRVKNGP